MSDDAKDLIERLRAIRNRVTFTSEAWERTMEQAAATIAALTAERDLALMDAKGGHHRWHLACNDYAEAEQRIREQGATIAAFKAEVEMWRDEAQLYSQNTKYWRERAEAAEAEIERLRELLLHIAAQCIAIPGNTVALGWKVPLDTPYRIDAALKGDEHG
jgi:chromosome segregation ATPase